MPSRAGSMAKTGKAVPTSEKLNTAHSEQVLIDILSDGISPNINAPKPCEAVTASSPSNRICHVPPLCGNPNMPYT